MDYQSGKKTIYVSCRKNEVHNFYIPFTFHDGVQYGYVYIFHSVFVVQREDNYEMSPHYTMNDRLRQFISLHESLNSKHVLEKSHEVREKYTFIIKVWHIFLKKLVYFISEANIK